MPFFSCILLSHDKPVHVGEAVESLIAQTFPDWEAVVFDSGVLHDRGFFSTLPTMKDPHPPGPLVGNGGDPADENHRVVVLQRVLPQKNAQRPIRHLPVRRRPVLPRRFQAFHDYAASHPQAMALYAAVDMTGVSAAGEKLVFREILAEEIKGSCCGGGALDCQVDYLQLCHKAELFDLFADAEFWPEDREVIEHADGIFLEKIGGRVPIYPVAAKIGENRKVPISLNTGGERLELLMEVCRREQEIGRLNKILADMGQELASLRGQGGGCLRHRVADKLNAAVKRVPMLHGLGKKVAMASWWAWRRSTRRSA